MLLFLQLEKANEEILRLTSDFSDYKKSQLDVTTEMEELQQEFETLTFKSRTVSSNSCLIFYNAPRCNVDCVITQSFMALEMLRVNCL